MNIYFIRHGQTRLNGNKLMNGRTDEPLSEAGVIQATEARKKVENIVFDAVYSSPLDRAISTALIVGNVERKDIIIDERIIEVDFGKYELKPYSQLGIHMTMFWVFPEIISAPDTVEPISSMVKRSREFLDELVEKEYKNVLVASHGGIIRALCGCLMNKKNGIYWRPKPSNCEIRVFENKCGANTYIGKI